MKTQEQQLDEILNSDFFNQNFNVENDIKELEESGWTLAEARSFAKFLIATSEK